MKTYSMREYKEMIEERRRSSKDQKKQAIFEELEQEKKRHQQIREMLDKANKDNKKEQVEILTVGLLKELMGERNIPQLQEIITGRSDRDYIDLIDREQYIATKLWSEEDIIRIIEEENINNSDEVISDIIKSRELRSLGECSDQEWDLIREVVIRSAKKINKQRRREYLR